MSEDKKNDSETFEIQKNEGFQGPITMFKDSIEKTTKNDEDKKSVRIPKEGISILSDEMKFMADFDPDNSLRRQKKNRRRYYHPDGRPMIHAQDYDDCDCLIPKCPGCHYPCKSCGDTRCGHECRVNRRWVYESLEVEGWNPRTLKNQHLENFLNNDYE